MRPTFSFTSYSEITLCRIFFPSKYPSEQPRRSADPFFFVLRIRGYVCRSEVQFNISVFFFNADISQFRDFYWSFRRTRSARSHPNLCVHLDNFSLQSNRTLNLEQYGLGQSPRSARFCRRHASTYLFRIGSSCYLNLSWKTLARRYRDSNVRTK